MKSCKVWVSVPVLLAALALRGQEGRSPAPAIKVHFNQELIDGLNAPLDLDDPMAVLDLVFGQLPDVARVYPSENYYYFQFAAAGQTHWGNLRLDARDRDQGILHLGYFRYDDSGRFQDRTGHFKVLTAADGVTVEKRAPFEYEVSYKGRTVRFQLNDPGMAPPRTARLDPDEAFVGPISDESGLRFHLLFHRTGKHFFYVLNEDAPLPEQLDRIDDLVVVGRRTGFAFYDDRDRNRKVLVAVLKRNTERNNYYDGPFDQLPDNYVESTKIASYMEEAYPESKGAIDRFGVYLHQVGGRLVVMPYGQWGTEEDLKFVAACKKKAETPAAFLNCITPDMQQMSACGAGNPCTAGRVIGHTSLKVTIPEAKPRKPAKPPGR